jgi:hypothetical protein
LASQIPAFQCDMALLDSLHVEADGRYGAVSRVVSLVLTGASSPNRFRDRVARVFIDGNLLDCELAALQRNVLVYFTGLDRIVSYRQNPQKRGLPCILKPDHGDVHLRRPACGNKVSPAAAAAPALHPSTNERKYIPE